NRSIGVEERFENLMTKADVLDQLKRPEEVASTRARAMELANPSQLYFYARGLQGNGKKDDALAQFKSLAKRYPSHWLSPLALAPVYSAANKFQHTHTHLASHHS